jgi:hypothetical protein
MLLLFWIQPLSEVLSYLTTLEAFSKNVRTYIKHLGVFLRTGWHFCVIWIYSNTRFVPNVGILCITFFVCYTHTLSLRYPCASRMFIPDPTFFHPGSALKNFKYFKPQKWFLSSGKYDPSCSSRIRILTFYPSRNPDSMVKKAPDPGSGSATLTKNYYFLNVWNLFCTYRRGDVEQYQSIKWDSQHGARHGHLHPRHSHKYW